MFFHTFKELLNPVLKIISSVLIQIFDAINIVLDGVIGTRFPIMVFHYCNIVLHQCRKFLLNEFIFSQLAEVICEETALRQENRKMSVIIAEAQTVTHISSSSLSPSSPILFWECQLRWPKKIVYQIDIITI